MTIEELGAIGEFLGVFVILATLVYLSIQTTQAKRIAAAESRRNVGNDFNDVWGLLGKDPEFTRLIRIAVNDWHALSRNEQMLAHAFFCQLMAHLDSTLQQQSLLPDLKDELAIWEDNILGFLTSPGGAEWFKTTHYLFEQTMIARLKARLDDPGTLPPSWVETMLWWQLDDNERNHKSTNA